GTGRGRAFLRHPRRYLQPRLVLLLLAHGRDSVPRCVGGAKTASAINGAAAVGAGQARRGEPGPRFGDSPDDGAEPARTATDAGGTDSADRGRDARHADGSNRAQPDAGIPVPQCFSRLLDEPSAFLDL